MCGILGQYNFRHFEDSENFEHILALSKRRGPDGSKIINQVTVKFGFNRLAILDTSNRGMQPCYSPSKRYLLMLNGEIYNFKSLQKEFRIIDVDLRSSSDVEVVAQLLDKDEPKEIVKKLNGMFAIAVYDIKNDELLIARDFAGIKPLFYGINKNGFVFASQFDQIFKHDFFKTELKISKCGLKDYYELGYMHSPNTVFENIFQLNPGHLITINNGGVKIEEYCTFPKFNNSNDFLESRVETTKYFIDVFRSVIKDQLVSDVPIGSFLSGGIDSPLVTAIAKSELKDIRSFTFEASSNELNELEQAKEYGNFLGINMLTDSLHESDIQLITDEHFLAYPEPFGDPSSLPTFIISKLSRKHLTVMLSGDGGDELFWGYPRFSNVLENALYFKYPKNVRQYLGYINRLMGKKVSYAVNDFDTIGDWQHYKHTHLGIGFVNSIFGETKHNSEIDELYRFNSKQKLDETELLQWLRWNEFYGHMQRILIKVDRASMYNSLEVRVPFLDKRVIDFAWRVYPEYGNKHHELKLVLKNAMEQFYPKKIIYKPKKGFSIPYSNYLKNELKQDILDHVVNSKIFGESFLNSSMVKSYVEGFINYGKGDPWGVWIIYAIQKWAVKYNLV